MVRPLVRELQTQRVMRVAVVAGVCSIVLVACTAGPDDGPGEGITSMRARLASEPHLFVGQGARGGSITALRRTDAGWASQRVPLTVSAGELVATAGGSGGVRLSGLALALEPVTIPSTVLGHPAVLTNLRLRLVAPTEVACTWSGDDHARAAAPLELELSWWLEVDGIRLPLGAPRLPPLPVALELSGDGAGIEAALHLAPAGELWSWADLVKLTDFELDVGFR